MRSLLSISKTRRHRGLRGAGPAERRGATLVEFALVSPILFVFMCCCFEFGRIAMMRASIANAAYEGARRASVPGSRADQAIQSATDVVSASGISSSTVTVNPTVFDASTRDVTVTVSVRYVDNAWIPAMFIGNATMQRSCTMSREINR